MTLQVIARLKASLECKTNVRTSRPDTVSQCLLHAPGSPGRSSCFRLIPILPPISKSEPRSDSSRITTVPQRFKVEKYTIRNMQCSNQIFRSRQTVRSDRLQILGAKVANCYLFVCRVDRCLRFTPCKTRIHHSPNADSTVSPNSR